MTSVGVLTHKVLLQQGPHLRRQCDLRPDLKQGPPLPLLLPLVGLAPHQEAPWGLQTTTLSDHTLTLV